MGTVAISLERPQIPGVRVAMKGAVLIGPPTKTPLVKGGATGEGATSGDHVRDPLERGPSDPVGLVEGDAPIADKALVHEEARRGARARRWALIEIVDTP